MSISVSENRFSRFKISLFSPQNGSRKWTMIRLYGTRPETVNESLFPTRNERQKHNELKQKLYYDTLGDDGAEFTPSNFISTRTKRFDFSSLKNNIKDEEDLREEDRNSDVVLGIEFMRLLSKLSLFINVESIPDPLSAAMEDKKTSRKKNKRKITFAYDEEGEEGEELKLSEKVVKMNSKIKFTKSVTVNNDFMYKDFIKYKVMSKIIYSDIKVNNYRFTRNIPKKVSLNEHDHEPMQLEISLKDAEDAIMFNISPPDLDFFSKTQFKLYLYSIVNRSEFFIEQYLRDEFNDFVSKKLKDEKRKDGLTDLKTEINNKFVAQGTEVIRSESSIGRRVEKIDVNPLLLKRLGLL